MYYAHSRNSEGKRQELSGHLQGVAERAAAFADPLGASEAARFLGLCHDIGKFDPAFQQYLLDSENSKTQRRGPDHKAAGASMALDQHLGLVALLAKGHHGGLGSPGSFRSWIESALARPGAKEALRLAAREVPALRRAVPIPLPAHATEAGRSAELFLRFLFSALVDADFLDTEAHFDAEASSRRGANVGIATLWNRFQADQARFAVPAAGTVAQVRRVVFDASLSAADNAPGLFKLTVPTGGGKTRSAMAFALRHAARNGQRQVVVAVPFISITEQTADVYRQIFETEGTAVPVVLEHHSGVADAGDDEEGHDRNTRWRRLSAENWDAPIVVTTTVQLFESLFGNRTSACRKLHRLANSVVILDEAQALPAHLLEPMLDVLQELCAHYGTTVIISTATQPAFDTIPVFARVNAKEIVPEPASLFAAMRRVDYEWNTDRKLGWPDVAQIMLQEEQALAVLNTKRDALALYHALDDPDALHLSTLLCGAHRRQVIRQVHDRLVSGQPCRLVSTQVIEAGVDLDFPLALRALGPLDRIIQTAGRCNREGRLSRGRVIVFRPEEERMPAGAYRVGYDGTCVLLGGGKLDPDDPAAARQYFEWLFQRVAIDREGIQGRREALDYPEVAKRFRMIDDDTISVLVDYGTTEERQHVREVVERLRAGHSNGRVLLRKLQPYFVSLRRRQAEGYERRGLLTTIVPGVGEWQGKYDRMVGITGDDVDPDRLVI